LCEKLGPHLKKQHTLMRNSVLIENMIIMSLIQLGNGNGLQLIGDIFEVTKRCYFNDCECFWSHGKVESLKIIYAIFWMSFNLEFCQKSLNLHGIPHIISVLHGSHISILTPLVGGEDYCCRKSFHYAILPKK
jgi:hypothetical protein